MIGTDETHLVRRSMIVFRSYSFLRASLSAAEASSGLAERNSTPSFRSLVLVSKQHHYSCISIISYLLPVNSLIFFPTSRKFNTLSSVLDDIDPIVALSLVATVLHSGLRHNPGSLVETSVFRYLMRWLTVLHRQCPDPVIRALMPSDAAGSLMTYPTPDTNSNPVCRYHEAVLNATYRGVAESTHAVIWVPLTLSMTLQLQSSV